MKRARGKQMMLAEARAMEKMAQRPQVAVMDNEVEHHEGPSGGEAGLARIVGAGRRKMKGAAEPSENACSEGHSFARYLRRHKGKSFLDAFHHGLMTAAEEPSSDEEEEMEGGRLRMLARPVTGPGAVPAVASSDPPQAPASFERNSVALDRSARNLAGGAMKPMSGKRSARGQLIAKLMKERGMTLGQASKHLKEQMGAL